MVGHGGGGVGGGGDVGPRLEWWDLSRGRGAAASHQQEIEERRLPPLYNLNFLMLCHSHPNVVDGITLLTLFQRVFGHQIVRSPFSWCTSSALRTPPKHISTGTTSGGAKAMCSYRSLSHLMLANATLAVYSILCSKLEECPPPQQIVY